MPIQSRLVRLATGKIGIEVTIGRFTATHELPDNLATASGNKLREYLNGIVPEMVTGLRERERDERRKIAKKADMARVLPLRPGADTGSELPEHASGSDSGSDVGTAPTPDGTH